MAGGRRSNAFQTSFTNRRSTVVATQKPQKRVFPNVTGAPAPLCESCRYPCRYIDAHRRRSDPGNFDKVQNVFSAMSAGYKAMTQLSVHPFEIGRASCRERV